MSRPTSSSPPGNDARLPGSTARLRRHRAAQGSDAGRRFPVREHRPLAERRRLQGSNPEPGLSGISRRPGRIPAASRPLPRRAHLTALWAVGSHLSDTVGRNRAQRRQLQGQSVAAVAQAGQHLGLDVDRARRQQTTPVPACERATTGRPASALLAMDLGDFAIG
jgi:hypothetical protein